MIEIAEAVGAGTAVENSWSVGCQKPLFWLTVLLQLGTILTYSGNIYPSYVRGRYQNSFLSLRRVAPTVGLEPMSSGSGWSRFNDSESHTLSLHHQRPVKRIALTHAICMVSDSRESPRVLGG